MITLEHLTREIATVSRPLDKPPGTLGIRRAEGLTAPFGEHEVIADEVRVMRL